jgi:hypothetical protein
MQRSPQHFFVMRKTDVSVLHNQEAQRSLSGLNTLWLYVPSIAAEGTVVCSTPLSTRSVFHPRADGTVSSARGRHPEPSARGRGTRSHPRGASHLATTQHCRQRKTYVSTLYDKL